jgi:2-keto-4-pentenoate hydratase/2-oxohepta-3-ene-1,7-dioic acid hydratase in catechol pathway
VRLVVYDEYRIGVLEHDGIHDCTDLLEAVPDWAAPYRMNALIARWSELRDRLEDRRAVGPSIALESVLLRAPSPRPRNFLAAPLNYAAHGAEMSGPISSGGGTPLELGLFVKAGGCLAGPSDDVTLPPIEDRRFDHEGEIGVVIGPTARGVMRDTALDHVFGYTLVLDATMRMTESRREERTMRKSFATFSPSGPCILTADEVPDPSELTVRLSVNGNVRQEGSLADLVVDVPGLVAIGSSVLALEPGDLIATGSPAGVGPIVQGDLLVVESEPIGQMRLRVTRRSW